MNASNKVLVVEDEPLIRLAAVDLVESAGFVALEATNADQAIAILEANRDIRLVFTDMDMPGSMNGVKLAQYVRNRWPPIHLIVASGKSVIAENDLPKGTRFFSKPYADHTIVDTMKSMLAQS